MTRNDDARLNLSRRSMLAGVAVAAALPVVAAAAEPAALTPLSPDADPRLRLVAMVRKLCASAHHDSADARVFRLGLGWCEAMTAELAADDAYNRAHDVYDKIQPKTPEALYVRDSDAELNLRGACATYTGRMWYPPNTVESFQRALQVPAGYQRFPASPRVQRAWDRMKEIADAARAFEAADEQAREASGLNAADEIQIEAFSKTKALALRMRVERASTPAGIAVKAAMVASYHTVGTDLWEARMGFDPNDESPLSDLASLLLDLVEAGERIAGNTALV
ncbi:hypothetical protein SLNSH_22730 [Alsobacter soli]|uniref:Uncharacterized protein n=1 Tax=Alsobacter soli TaxID=2109933 RepID=A0A2T1HM64_9HYPH|nr:hypothetical protein [Alsobacter soli]PSC02681.1 hypothetical protein SLNSH_22730 [Alsobacter soli]